MPSSAIDRPFVCRVKDTVGALLRPAGHAIARRCRLGFADCPPRHCSFAPSASWGDFLYLVTAFCAAPVSRLAPSRADWGAARLCFH
jgi:hypothetical protein